eukprot:212167_1
MPFLMKIDLIKFEDVTDKKCQIPICKAYKSRDIMIIHLLSECMDIISHKPNILLSHIIPYIHLYGNNKEIKDKNIISRVHYLYSMTVKYLSLRWMYFDVSKRLFP